MTTHLEARVKDLENKVQELNDREALRDLRCRYHECINEEKLTEIPALFAEDGEIDFGHLGKAAGHAKIREFFVDHIGLGCSISWVRQFIHNHTVHIHGDNAHGFAYLEAKPVYKGESFLVAARYDDEYVKRGGQWKFSKMRLTPYFMTPLKEGWAQEERVKMR